MARKKTPPTGGIQAYNRGGEVVVELTNAEGASVLSLPMSWITAWKLRADLDMALTFALSVALQKPPTPRSNTMDPYVMKKVRQAYIHVLGKMWLPAVEAGALYPLSDHDLSQIKSFTRKDVGEWLTKKRGTDFQWVIDFRAVCGEEVIDWETKEGEERFAATLVEEP